MRKLQDWRPGRLTRGTLQLLIGFSFRSLAQIGIFFIVVRTLGVEGYGAYTAILAIATLFGQLHDLGTLSLLVRDAARDPSSLPRAWGRALQTIFLFAPINFAFYIMVQELLDWDTPFEAFLWIGVAEIVLCPFANIGFFIYQALEKFGQASYFFFIPNLLRLLAALSLLFARQHPDPLVLWCQLYAGSTALAALYVTLHTCLSHRKFEFPPLRDTLRSLPESLPFTIHRTAQKAYADLDKAMIAHFDSLTAAGGYSVAYRISDLALLPVMALLNTTIPDFFRHGQHGAQVTYRRIVTLLPFPLLYTSLAGFGLVTLAPFLPDILGEGYHKAVQPLQALAWLPTVRTIALFAQQGLMASGSQGLEAKIFTGVVISNIALNYILIQNYGWLGAVLSIYFSTFSHAAAGLYCLLLV